jgi:hypothetical protein
MLQLKRDEIMQNATQHGEILATKTMIANSLAQILSALQK